jgi:polyhydroxyalkanoate synthesis regulator phasin
VSELVALVERMIKAFRSFGYFFFEDRELQRVRDVLVKAEIDKLVEVKPVDEKYPYIVAVTASRRNLEHECVSRVDSLLAKGSISQDEYKRYRRELIEQCIISLEKERVKEIVKMLENYLNKIKQG